MIFAILEVFGFWSSAINTHIDICMVHSTQFLQDILRFILISHLYHLKYICAKSDFSASKDFFFIKKSQEVCIINHFWEKLPQNDMFIWVYAMLTSWFVILTFLPTIPHQSGTALGGGGGGAGDAR